MAEAVQRPGGLVTPDVSTEPGRSSNSVMATTVIGAHGLEHMYAHSFNVILPVIYDALGLVPIQGALLLVVRRLAGASPVWPAASSWTCSTTRSTGFWHSAWG